MVERNRSQFVIGSPRRRLFAFIETFKVTNCGLNGIAQKSRNSPVERQRRENMIARGDALRVAQRLPLDHKYNDREALKERNN